MTNPLHLLALVLWALWSAPAAAQQKAEASFHHRTTDAGVELRIDVEIEPGWHLYHTDLGTPDAIGTITTVEIDTIGAVFGEVRFPEPHWTPMEFGSRGVPTRAKTHDGTITLWAFGAWEDEPDPELDVWVTMAGQTCSDMTGMCIQYEQELDSLGAGDDALWADFPADLVFALEPEPEPFTLDQGGGGFGFADFGAEEGGGFGDAYAAGSLYHRIEGDRVDVLLRIEVADDWHLYGEELGHPQAIGLPTSVEFAADGVTFDGPVFSPPHRISQEELGEGIWIYGYDDEVLVSATGTVDGTFDPATLTATIGGQTCSDLTGTCILYGEEVASLGAGDDAVWARAAAAAGAGHGAEADGGAEGDGPAGGLSDPRGEVGTTDPGAGTEDPATLTAGTDGAGGESGGGDLWGFILLCIGGGIFTLLMPCTYPMIPITISFFTKQAETAGKPTIGLPLAYGAGIIAVFVFIGVAIGPVIIPFAQHWLTNAIIGVAFLYFGLVLLGMITLNPPRFMLNLAGSASQSGGLVGVFLMGTTLVVTSFTCTAPILGSILSVGAASEDADLGRIALGMAVFGLTMAVPFVALSLVPGKLKAMPSSGEWMNTLKVTLGFVEIAAAFKFLSNWDVAKQAGLLPDELLLLVWVVVLLVASAYLLGFVRIKGGSAEISPGRALAGTTFLGLTGYLVLVLFGYPRSELMHAFLPGYSAYDGVGVEAVAGGVTTGSPGAVTSHTIIKDDYDAALARAASEGRLLLVNLTGFT